MEYRTQIGGVSVGRKGAHQPLCIIKGASSRTSALDHVASTQLSTSGCVKVPRTCVRFILPSHTQQSRTQVNM